MQRGYKSNYYDTEISVHIRCNGASKCDKTGENQVFWFGLIFFL